MKNITIFLAFMMMALWGNAQSWTLQTSGTTQDLFDVIFLNDTLGYVAGTGSVLKTIDGGNTWNILNNGITSTHSLYSITFVTENIGWAVGENGSIYKTTNAGSSWAVQSSGTTERLMSVFFIDQNVGWISSGADAVNNTDPVTLYTTNGGTTWNTVGMTFSIGNSRFIRSIFFRSNTLGWVVADYGKMARTTDGGLTWNVLTSGTPNRLRKVLFTSDADGWAVGENGTILVSSDTGSTWSTLSSGTTNTLTDINVMSNVAFVVGWSSTVLRTNDSGANWSSIATGINTSTELRATHFLNPSQGWAVGGSGKIFKFNPTTGINEFEDFNTNIYPNPFDNLANISFKEEGNYSIQVLDINGRELLNTKINAKQTTLNTSSWSSGVYNLIIKHETGYLESKRIVKQ